MIYERNGDNLLTELLLPNYRDSYRVNYMLSGLIWYLCTYFIYTDFNIKQMLGYMCLSVLLLLKLRINSTIVFTPLKRQYILIIISILTFCVFSDALSVDNMVLYMSVAFLTLIYLLCLKSDKIEIRNILEIVEIIGLLWSLFFILIKIFPNVYWKICIPYLSHVTRLQAYRYMPTGRGIPVAGGYTYITKILPFAIIISVVKFLNGKKKSSLLTGICFIGLLCQGRRSEVIALMLTLLALKKLYAKSINFSNKLKRFAKYVLVILILVGVLRYLLLNGLLKRYVDTFDKIVSVLGKGGTIDAILGGTHDITSGRIVLWEIAWKKFISCPIFGIGWGRFSEFVPSFYYKTDTRGMVANVHNDTLQILCETGIIGFLLIIVPFWYCTIRTYYMSKRFDIGAWGDLKSIAAVSFGVQLFLLILGMMDPCMYASFFWLFYVISIALADFVWQQDRCE